MLSNDKNFADFLYWDSNYLYEDKVYDMIKDDKYDLIICDSNNIRIADVAYR